MNNGLPFRPVVGLDSAILRSSPTEGYLWFATDTKKIYYSDGNSFLSMGGNTGIYYGQLEHEEDEDTDKKEFEFLLEDIDGNENVIDGNYKKPNIDDLILNIPDGCFYRVTHVLDNNTKFIGLKLTIAGSGGSGGGGGVSSTTVLKITDADNEGFRKYFTQDATTAKIRFTVSATPQMPDNGISLITYKISGQSEVITDTDFKDFGTIEFDLAPYLSKMSTTTVTNVTITVEDLYGARKSTTFYISVVNLTLTSSIVDKILTTSTGEISYNCTPSGGNSLNDRQVIVSFYDSADNHLANYDIIEPISIANNEIPLVVKVPAIGVYTMKVVFKGQVVSTKEWIESNVLNYKTVFYNENPQLVVSIPPTKIEQYSTIEIDYMIAMMTDSVEKVQVSLIKNGESIIQEVDYNQLNTWSIYFDQIGQQTLSIVALGVTEIIPEINVVEYSGNIPVISTTGLTVNFSAVNRTNTEMNKDTWVSTGTNKNVQCKFENFAWGNINGWQKDEDNVDILRLSSGAKLTILDYSPYEKDAMSNGQTIELDFKVSGVTDFSKPLIYCLSYDNEGNIQVGFNVTGQESTLNTSGIKATGGIIVEGDSDTDQIYNTQIQGVTAKFIENKRIHLSWVIERKSNNYPMIKTYLNGILSGITQYNKSNDSMIENISSPARITFDSTYGNIDIYNIRIYEISALNSNTIIDNYIATFGTTDEKATKYEDNVNVLDNQNRISISTIETAHDNNGYKLSIPYIKISGGTPLIKADDGNYYKNNTSTSGQGLPTTKKDYRTVDEMIFVDHNKKRPEFNQKSIFKDDGSFNGIVMYGQGTSSMEYPVKNLRFKSKLKINDEKFLFTVNDCNVDLICLKVDYMESSGSHNTGTGNLVYTLLNNIPDMSTPGQDYWNNKVDYDVVTAIRGFPVAVFYKNSEDEDAAYEFIGKGNFNLDKATHEPFGFINEPKNVPEAINSSTFGWSTNDNLCRMGDGTIITPEEKPIINSIHCYEFLNNASNLANFLSDSDSINFEDSFFKIVDSDGDKVPNWFTSYESRFPEGDADDGSDIDIGPFFRLCKWLNSTSQMEATDKELDSAVIYNGNIYTHDTIEYRKAKFKAEFNEYLDFNFTAFYYILTHVLLMIDSRAKNMMIATWDNKIWYPIFYDMDTMLGLNNYGYNKFNYDTEDTDDNVYNGQNSVLWNNFRDTFNSEIRSFYQVMQTGGMTYQNLLTNYNQDQADAPNENIYNADAQYKYIRPFTESYYDGLNGVTITPGSKDFLYASQGSRSMHREWWLKNRINYFNGKYLSDLYKNDRYVMRLYTPSVSGYYIGIIEPLKEEFDEGLYYINIGTYDNPIYEKATVWDIEGINYYKWIDSNSQLADTIREVPPSNNFTLTPLYNQYLSVAYGGANGQTTSPIYVKANQPQLIEAPSGAQYNDTETYVYGGTMLKDLGDLSSQYLGSFRFPDSETKLESLTLGNFNNKYYNPNFSSLTIGDKAPYLANLNITNCIGLKGRSLDLIDCQNLKKLYATGTGLTSISFPGYGVINELRLPESLTQLALNNQINLTKNNFTIGTYNSNTSEYTYIGGKKLILLDIQNTPIDTYQLVKDSQNTLQFIRLTDINWTISTIDTPEDVEAIKSGSIPVLDILNSSTIRAIDIPGLTKKQAITGTITFKKDLGLSIEQAMNIYNKYIVGNNNNNTFPNLNFVFEGLDIFNVDILDGNGNIYWTRKIASQDTLTKEFLSSGPKGTFITPTMNSTIQYIYTFNNKWDILINGIDTGDIQGSIEEGYNGWPIDINYGVNSDIVLKPDFEETLQKYTITVSNRDNEEDFIYSGEFEYGTNLNEAIESLVGEKVPYKNDNGLKFDKTYHFEGYNTDKEASIALTFGDNYIVSGTKTYYAIFKEVSVYTNVYRDYFTYSTVSSYNDTYDTEFNITGVQITGLTKHLRGKITIPAYIELPSGIQPVWGIYGSASGTGVFEGNTDITHVFFENHHDFTKHQFRVVGRKAFLNTNIKYFQFTENLREIRENSFQYTPLEPDPNITEPSYKLNTNLVRIGDNAFNQALKYDSAATIYIPSSVIQIDHWAFSVLKVGDGSSIIIGESGNLSKLDFTKSTGFPNSTDIISFAIIWANVGDLGTIEFYSEKYDAGDNILLGTNGIYGQFPIEQVIGQGSTSVEVY